MGKSQRDKGLRVERGIVARFREAGIPAERVPLSGAAGGAFSGDVRAFPAGPELIIEVKGRAVGGVPSWRKLLEMKGENEVLIVKEDGCEPVVITRLDAYLARLGQPAPAVPDRGESSVPGGSPPLPAAVGWHDTPLGPLWGVVAGHGDGDDPRPGDSPADPGDGE